MPARNQNAAKGYINFVRGSAIGCHYLQIHISRSIAAAGRDEPLSRRTLDSYVPVNARLVAALDCSVAVFGIASERPALIRTCEGMYHLQSRCR
jgi:hypothetical protein